MTAVVYSSARFSAQDTSGGPLVGGKLYTYQNGTEIEASTYSDSTGTINANPIVLDERGEAVVYVDPMQVYTFVLRDGEDEELIWSQDGITGTTSSVDFGVFKGDLAAGTADPALLGFLQSGPDAELRDVLGKMREQYVSPLDFGGEGDGETDDTCAIKKMFESGATRFDFLNRRWLVVPPVNAALHTFTEMNGLRFVGAGAVFVNTHVYLSGDPFSFIFDFVRCNDVEISVDYEGVAQGPNFGVLGGSYVRWSSDSDGLKLVSKITYARYGVLSGSYGTPSQGNARNMDLEIDAEWVGYPLAAYYATGVRAMIRANHIHRGAYLGGIENFDVTLYWQNQYGADVVGLTTDAKTADATQRGCRNGILRSYCTGGEHFEPSSACCGFLNSRYGPVTLHENLTYEYSVTSSDTEATTVSGFKLASGPLPGGEPHYWGPAITLRNFVISGTIDRAGQTLPSGTVGDFYWNSHESAGNTATVENVVFRNISTKSSSGASVNNNFTAPGLVDQVFFDSVNTPATALALATNPASQVVFNNCVTSPLLAAGTVGQIHLANSIIGSVPDSMTAIGLFTSDSQIGGGGMRLRMKQVTATLAGASVTLASFFPAGGMVMALSSRVQTAIAGSTGYQLGISTDLARYANVNNTTVGNTTDARNYAVTEIAPRVYPTAAALVISSKTANFTDGVVKLNLYYYELTAQTS